MSEETPVFGDAFLYRPDLAKERFESTISDFEVLGIAAALTTTAQLEAVKHTSDEQLMHTRLKPAAIGVLEEDIMETARKVRQDDELPPLEKYTIASTQHLQTAEERTEMLAQADELVLEVQQARKSYMPLAGHRDHEGNIIPDNGEEMMTKLAIAKGLYEEAIRFTTEEYKDTYEHLHNIVKNDNTQHYLDYVNHYLTPMHDITSYGMIPRNRDSANLSYRDFLHYKDGALEGEEVTFLRFKELEAAQELLEAHMDDYHTCRKALHMMRINTTELFDDPEKDGQGSLKDRPFRRTRLAAAQNFLQSEMDAPVDDTLLGYETRRAHAYVNLAEAQELYASLFKRDGKVTPGDHFKKLTGGDNEIELIEREADEYDNRSYFLNKMREYIGKHEGKDADDVLLNSREHGTLEVYSFKELVDLLHDENTPLRHMMSEGDFGRMREEFHQQEQTLALQDAPRSEGRWGTTVGTHQRRRLTLNTEAGPTP